jgi:hypothetical protein
MAENSKQASTPNAYSGYLLVGQYGQGTSWGSIYSNYNITSGNQHKNDTDPDTVSKYKIINGYKQNEGVSLGLFGGYVQFDMGNAPIKKSSNNPYGVDFVIYGNVVGTGSAEPGSVQVSPDGKIWYELAGAHYYDASTVRNVTVNYRKVTSTDSTHDNIGIWFNLNGAADAFVSRNLIWWPDYNDSSVSPPLPEFSGVMDIDGEVNTDGGAPYAFWTRPSGAFETIEFTGITGLDSNSGSGTEYYLFGYFDVTPNGGSPDGTAVNPYQPYATGKIGGDGFDLSWAVDISTGEPVDISNMSFRYVRLYTAIYTIENTGQDRSAEVCGLYTAVPAGNPVGTTAAPTVTVGGTPVTPGTTTVPTIPITADVATTVVATAAGSGSFVYINSSYGQDTASASFTLGDGETQIVRIIVQDGTTNNPYIGFIELRGVE